MTLRARLCFSTPTACTAPLDLLGAGAADLCGNFTNRLTIKFIEDERHARAVRNPLWRLGFLLTCLVALPLPCLSKEPQALPALNIAIAETSISGISSGTFMSVQFQVAHSSIVRGVGIIAGGPYYCGQNNVITATTQCSCTLDPTHMVCNVSPTSADVYDSIWPHEASPPKTSSTVLPIWLSNACSCSPAAETRLCPTPWASNWPSTTAYFPYLLTRLEDPAGHAGHTMPTVAYGNDCAVTDSPSSASVASMEQRKF